MSIHVFSSTFYKLRDAYVHRISQELQQIVSLCTVIQYFHNVNLIKSLDGYGYDQWTLEFLIGILLVLIIASLFWPTSPSRSPTKDSQRARTALQALQTVIVPTCSLWPVRYINLVQHASTNGTQSNIIIPFSMLLQDIYDGVIELRDPVSESRGPNRWRCLCVWLSHASERRVEVLGGLFGSDGLHGDISDDTKNVHSSYLPASTHLDRLFHSSTTAPSSSVDGPIINFDNHPLTHLATIQLPQGSHMTLEITSLSNHISFLSMKHVLCTIPFLACRLPHCLSDTLAMVNDTRHFKLSTLTNTSAAYADTLAAASSTLAYDPVARQQCVDELGIKGWRKRRLMLEFEAALVRKGWLERWNMVLEAR
ncbi:hypothetical protein DFH29DRAFT_1080015 [Suillus ampliporus]|nr:hypothetical protein DFH29DRAFT_1080015 [Suillus ampliporus]